MTDLRMRLAGINDRRKEVEFDYRMALRLLDREEITLKKMIDVEEKRCGETIVRNPAPDAAPPTAMPQIYGSYSIAR